MQFSEIVGAVTLSICRNPHSYEYLQILILARAPNSDVLSSLMQRVCVSHIVLLGLGAELVSDPGISLGESLCNEMSVFGKYSWGINPLLQLCVMNTQGLSGQCLFKFALN